MDILLEENPIGGNMDFYNPYAISNPRRRHRKSRKGFKLFRNPGGTETFKEWTQGVTVPMVAFGVAGFAASAMVPGMLIKTTSTTTQKLLKIVAAIAVALGMGAVARSFASAQAGQAAVMGGLMGAASQAVGAFTPWKIGEGARVAYLPAASVGRAPVGRYPAAAEKAPFGGVRLV